MHAAAVGRTEQEEDEQGIDQQDIFHRVVFFLAALPCRLCRRVLGADDASFGPVMGTRGKAWRDSRYGDHGRWRLLQRDAPGGGVGFRDAKPLGEGRGGAGVGIAKGAECRQ